MNEYNRLMIPVAELKALQTIQSGHFDDLKLERDGVRWWISRCGIADGQPCDEMVTVEEFLNGVWEAVFEYNDESGHRRSWPVERKQVKKKKEAIDIDFDVLDSLSLDELEAAKTTLGKLAEYIVVLKGLVHYETVEGGKNAAPYLQKLKDLKTSIVVGF